MYNSCQVSYMFENIEEWLQRRNHGIKFYWWGFIGVNKIDLLNT